MGLTWIAPVAMGHAYVHTVEHVLSALHGIGIDNARLEVEGDEPPHLEGGDGSNFARLMSEVRTLDLNEAASYLVVTRPLNLQLGSCRARVLPVQGDPCLRVKVNLRFPQPIGQQSYTYQHRDIEGYVKEIAWARSFCWKPNSFRLPSGETYWEEMRQRLRILPADPCKSPILCFDNAEWVVGPRFPLEPSRHKILDFLGDLYLLGGRIYGDFDITLPGHAFTRLLAKELLSKGFVRRSGARESPALL
jgi:UDP-3-O-acyl-N-acetylglucosamine deacetylase